MTLAMHAVTGAAFARIFPKHPATAFLAGFFSHFLIDAIPHWDYKLRSARNDHANPLNNDIVVGREFVFDLFKIAADVIIGFWAAMIIFSGDGFGVIFVGAVAGVLPDALQFAYFKIRREPLVLMQLFHQWIHTDKKMTGRPVAGIFSQIALTLLIIFSSFVVR